MATLIQGGAGQDTVVVTGLTLTEAQRAQIFTGSVETITDASGTYRSDRSFKAVPAVTIKLASDTGSSAIDRVTSGASLTGGGDAGAVVHFTVDGVAVTETATADASGRWDYQPTGLGDGVHTITASETDSAGNVGTTRLTFTLDTSKPTLTSTATYFYPNSTHAISTTFVVTTSEAVTGLDVNDFVVTATGTASGNVTNVFGSGQSYTVTVSGITGNGSLSLALASDSNASDVAGNAFGSSAFTSSAEHKVTNAAPVAYDTYASIQLNGSSANASPYLTKIISGSDADYDALTLIAVKADSGSNSPTPILSTSGTTLINGLYGTLSVLSNSGTYSYAVATDAIAGVTGKLHDKFEYTVSDGHGGTDSATFDILINRSPTAADDKANSVGGTLRVDAVHGVLANDVDTDGDQFVVTAVGADESSLQLPFNGIAGTYGTFTLNTDGSYTYVPNSVALSIGEVAHDRFYYTVAETGGYYLGSRTDPGAWLDITVNGPAPIGAQQGKPPASIPLHGTSNGGVTQTEPDGTKIVARYDTNGRIASIKTTETDGSSDTFTYANGALTSETQVHVDKTKDVFLSNIAGKSYVAEHDVYNSAGTLIEATRTHTDGTTDYRYVLASDGTKTTDQYDPSGLVLKSHVVQGANGYSNVQTFTNGVLTKEVLTYAAGGTEISNTKLFNASGMLTSETQVHADKTKDVFLSNIAGKTYVAEHDVYNSAGTLIEATRTHTDGTTDYRYALASDGTKTTDQYDSSGLVPKSHVVQGANGYSDVQTFTNGVLTKEVITYAAGGAEVSNTKLFNASGMLTSETQVHADKTKDVFLSNIAGKSYVAEHDVYNSAGTLIEATRTHTDGTTDYRYVLASDGTKTTDQYDPSGLVLKSHVVQGANGYSDVQTFTNGVLTKEVLTYAAGGTEISNTKLFNASGMLTSETQAHADKTKDVFLSSIAGKTYVAEHDVYNTLGQLLFADQTNLDGSHTQTAYRAGAVLASTASVVDQFKSVGGDTFVFAAGFGKDTVSGFHAGSAPGFDRLVIDQAQATDFTDLKALHMSMSGGDTVLTLSNTDTITLKGVKMDLLTETNFHFNDHGLFHV
ncbi:Ig-like domain-containing protein [Methylobacterium sp. SD21]|uniref:Ig-like domain-containing protein n=1 Tax=Methylobacterium litchii TaxID=3138810 RepID=UPI00313C781F